MRSILIVLCFIFLTKMDAQRYIDYDTIHRNEFSASFQPFVTFFTGASESSVRVNFQLGYRHYFKNKLILRTSLLLFPDNRNGNKYYDLNLYDRTINGVNVFREQYNKNGLKTQMNIGLEKIFRVNRLMHGIGVDFFVNHQRLGYNEIYTWYPTNEHVGTILGGLYPSSAPPSNMVDSLGGNYHGTQIGVGFQLFYSLRYKISRHWYISGTVGPSVNFSVLNADFYDRRVQKSLHTLSYNVDIPDMPLISDISICFRF